MMIDFKTVYVCNIALFVLTYIYTYILGMTPQMVQIFLRR